MMNRVAIHPGSTHCVFRSGAGRFALPADAVREVLPCPALVAVPHSDPVLVGVCHLRSEFVPVLRPNELALEGERHPPTEQQLIVIDQKGGPWGLLVDQVAGLMSLELSAAADDEAGEVQDTSALVGWATYESEIVRVLDAQRLHAQALETLTKSWSRRAGRAQGTSLVSV